MSKRGRPRANEAKAKREAVIQAAIDELVEKGYENITMLGVAKRASASKETLYSWFGNKEGLFSALIKHQAETTVTRVKAALEGESELRATLTDFATGLLRVLLSEPSVSLNRAAMSSPELADVLLKHGRHATGPIVEGYLERLAKQGVLRVSSPQAAFQLLYGLIIQDWQIRVLLGEKPPTKKDLSRHADVAVEQFLALCSADA